jgi:prolipoprotein diacylglyceryltransferase
MFEPTISILSFTMSTYTVLIALALAIGGGVVLYRTPQQDRLRVLDALIVGLVGAMVLGRVEHVLLNWTHFAFHRGEILQINAGGLDWHGAFVGAGVGMLVGARWRGVSLRHVVDSLTLMLPLLSLAIWWGCWSASCRYGLEVETLADYPSWMVWEARDIFGIYAPRFHTQLIGLGLSLVLLGFALVLFWKQWLYFRRFWLLGVAVTGVMFGVSWLQGDYAPTFNGIPIAQYLDVIFMIYMSYLAIRLPRSV